MRPGKCRLRLVELDHEAPFFLSREQARAIYRLVRFLQESVQNLQKVLHRPIPLPVLKHIAMEIEIDDKGVRTMPEPPAYAAATLGAS